jgi:hypothetical protein
VCLLGELETPDRQLRRIREGLQEHLGASYSLGPEALSVQQHLDKPPAAITMVRPALPSRSEACPSAHFRDVTVK